MQYCCRKVSAHPFVFATVRTFFSWFKLFKIITYATDKQQIRTMETLFPRYIAPNVSTSLTSFLSLDLRERRCLQCDWVRDTYTITDTVSWKISTCHLWKKMLSQLQLSKLLFFSVYINCNNWTLTAMVIVLFHWMYMPIPNDELSFHELYPLL